MERVWPMACLPERWLVLTSTATCAALRGCCWARSVAAHGKTCRQGRAQGAATETCGYKGCVLAAGIRRGQYVQTAGNGTQALACCARNGMLCET